MWAHDADAHLLGSAEASTPLGGGVIASHVTAFRGDHLRWERRIIPTAEQYRNPAALAMRQPTPARRRSGSTPVAAPITTSATTGHPGARHATPPGHCSSEPRAQVYVVARTKVDVDTAISYAAELETRHLVAV